VVLGGRGEDNGSGNPATSCNVPNNIGFKITNCEKASFPYFIFDGKTRTALTKSEVLFTGCASHSIGLFIDPVIEEGKVVGRVSAGASVNNIDAFPNVETPVPNLLNVCI